MEYAQTQSYKPDGEWRGRERVVSRLMRGAPHPKDPRVSEFGVEGWGFGFRLVDLEFSV